MAPRMLLEMSSTRVGLGGYILCQNMLAPCWKISFMLENEYSMIFFT